jgi:LacI family transcriptional regulator
MEKREAKQNVGKKCTLKDVADMAQVSIATVSHTLNGTAKISQTTQQRVIDAAWALGYRSPGDLESPAELHRDRKIIGVIVQDICNEFYAACASSVLACADHTNYTLLLCDCVYDSQREVELVHDLICQHVSGLIFFGGTEEAAPVKLAHTYHIPVVLANRCVDGFSSVMYGNAKIIRETITTLYNAGSRKFLYLTESLDLHSVRDRYDGFLLGMLDHNVPSSDYQILTAKRLQRDKVQAGYDVLSEYIQKNGVNFDTIITTSDLIAVGVLKCLRESNCRVPEDVQVVGYDDISIAALVSPPLTTIHQDTARLGQEAFNLLCEIMQSGHSDPKQVVIENKLVIRDSTRNTPQKS